MATMYRVLTGIVWLGFAATAVPMANLYEGENCTLADGMTNGTCRDHSACPYLKTIPKKDWVTCSFHRPLGPGTAESPIVCCREESKKGSARKPAVSNTRISTRVQSCDETSGLINHIFGGNKAMHEDFPYIAALGYDTDDEETTFRCGASLISREFLLTAAHCFSPDKPKFARFGVADLFDKDPTDEPIDVDIVSWIPHPNYKKRPLENDIALVQLKRNMTESFLKLACLYTEPTDPSPSEVLKIAGWGATRPNEGTSRYLLYANVSMIDRGTCDTTLLNDKTPRKTLFRLGGDQVCAIGTDDRGETITDTCEGDSGGPLELTVGRRPYIVGVTSSGRPCGSRWPGIYTRVSSFVDWIESIVWPM